MGMNRQLAPDDGNAQTASGRCLLGFLCTTKGILAFIIVAAVLLRVASAAYQGNTVVDLPGIYDQLSYHGLAQRVAAGYGFNFGEDHWPATPAGEPTAHWSYLYTIYLAAIYSVFGVQPIVARLLQAVLAGVLHTWLAWRIGKGIFGPPVGMLAAAFSAVYIYFFYYAGGLLTETFYLTSILWTIDVALRINRRRGQPVGWPLWIELGLSIAVTGMLRQVFLLFVPFLFLWLLWVRRDTTPGTSTVRRVVNLKTIGGLAVVTLIVACLIAPWTFRNYRAFGMFVPLNTNAGFAFFWGNHPSYGTRWVPLLGSSEYHDLIPDELLSLNEAELDRELLRRAVGFIADDPVRFLLLSLDRSWEYFKFWPSAESGMISNIARVGSFALFLPLMIYGLWLSVRYVRKPLYDGQSASIFLLYMFMVVYTGIHLATWTLIRYRLPVDSLLIVFAGLAAVNIAVRFGWQPSAIAESPNQHATQAAGVQAQLRPK
jgi:hypothetical protein